MLAADVATRHAGIAKTFKERFGGIEEMRAQAPRVGGVVALRRGRRYVYALVTKERSSGTYPTLGSLRACLKALRERMQADGVTHVAVPRLGCGLDRLAWPDVRAALLDVFAGCSVRITVYEWA